MTCFGIARYVFESCRGKIFRDSRVLVGSLIYRSCASFPGRLDELWSSEARPNHKRKGKGEDIRLKKLRHCCRIRKTFRWQTASRVCLADLLKLETREARELLHCLYSDKGKGCQIGKDCLLTRADGVKLKVPQCILARLFVPFLLAPTCQVLCYYFYLSLF